MDNKVSLKTDDCWEINFYQVQTIFIRYRQCPLSPCENKYTFDLNLGTYIASKFPCYLHFLADTSSEKFDHRSFLNKWSEKCQHSKFVIFSVQKYSKYVQVYFWVTSSKFQNSPCYLHFLADTPSVKFDHRSFFNKWLEKCWHSKFVIFSKR